MAETDAQKKGQNLPGSNWCLTIIEATTKLI